jgi:multidrug efflux pump subunit AcrA (membrane-fusion protein)
MDPQGNRRLGRAALVVGCLLLAVGCAKSTPRQAALPSVSATSAAQGTVRPIERLAGLVAPYQNVAIQSTLSEPADQVNVNEGDVVRRGEVLAQFDTADLQASLDADLANAQSARANTSKTVYQGTLSIAQGVDTLSSAQAAVRQAQSNLQRDQADLNRYHALAQQGYVSAQQLQASETTVRDDVATLRSLQAAVSSAQSNVTANGSLQGQGVQAATVEQSHAAEAAALAQAQQERVAISKATVISPIEGVVVNRNINPGEYPGTRQIFTLQQVDPIYAVLRGSGSQIALLATGAAATVQSSDLRRSFAGHVVGILNQVQPGSTDFEVKVALRNPQSKLRPGMAVEAVVSLPPLQGVTVPVTAFTDDSHTAILTIDDSDTVHTATVSEVGNDGTTAVVNGLRAGTRIVSNGQSGVGEGQKVAVR